jgi:hypothetical protein
VLGPVDYFLWFASAALEAGVVLCALWKRAFFRYFTLNVYMLAAFVFTLVRYFIFANYGFSSPQYFYFYYYSDALLTICLYFGLMGLFIHVFEEMGVHRFLRIGTLLLLGGTAWFSYQVVAGASDRLLDRFVVELSQNLYFVGLGVSYILAGAMMKVRETRLRLIQFVLSFGVYFSALAAFYAARNMFPVLLPYVRWLPALMGTLLPLAWIYAYTKVSEEARLATEHVAAVQHSK